MPIYDYECASCSREFELFLKPREAARCPHCGGGDLHRRISPAALGTETTKGLGMRAARKRDARQADQMNRTQREYEESHDDDH